MGIGSNRVPTTTNNKRARQAVQVDTSRVRIPSLMNSMIRPSILTDGPWNGWLTTADRRLSLQAGDFIEADVMLVAHAEGTEALAVPQRERLYYGTEGPSAEANTGQLIQEFPATVVAEDEVVSMSLKGGTEATPVIAKGFDHWSLPLLWIGGTWQNQQGHGGDGCQVDPDGDGKYRFTFPVKQRGGHPRNVTITRAQCSTDISRAVDRSGYLELVTGADVGDFLLKAPALFAPGKNIVTKGAPVSTFTGAAKSVRQGPLSVNPADDQVTVEVSAWDENVVEVAVDGAARIEFQSLSRASSYRLTVNGKEQIRKTGKNQRTISFEVPRRKQTVKLEEAD